MERIVHSSWWLIVWFLGILTAYFFIGALLPARIFYQTLNIDTKGGDIQMTFLQDVSPDGKIKFMNCSEGVFTREKRKVEVLPYIYKEIEVINNLPFTGNNEQDN